MSSGIRFAAPANKIRSRRRMSLRSPLLSGIALAAVALVLPATALAGGLQGVQDGFSRSTYSGVPDWTSVDTAGGYYSYENNADGASFHVLASISPDCANPCGYMTAPLQGSFKQAQVEDTYQSSSTMRDVDLTADFELASLPSAGTERISVLGRLGGPNFIDGYLGTISVNSSGTLTYGATKAVGNPAALTDLGTWKTVASAQGAPMTADSWWHVEMQIYSTSTAATTINMRVWRVSKPGFLYTTNTTNTLETSGIVGLRATRGSNVGNNSRIYYDNFVATNLDTPPFAPADPGVSGGSKIWTAGSRTITASNATLGSLKGGQTDVIDHYEYQVLTNNSVGSIQTGQSANLNTDGTSFVQFRAVDAYGNVSAWWPTTFVPQDEARVDAAAPTTPTVTGGFQNAVAGPVAVEACCSVDTESGLAYYNYRVSTDNGGSWSTPAVATNDEDIVSAVGTTLVQFQAVDNAGNTSAWGGPSNYTNGGDPSNHVTIATGAGNGTDACSTFSDPIRGQGIIKASFEGPDGKVHLTEAGSPWVVNCRTLFDDPGVPLVVDPGATVVMGHGSDINGAWDAALQVNGSITVGSNSGPPVLFTSTPGETGNGHAQDWAGITVSDTGNGTSSFTNVTLRYGGGVSGTNPVIATGSGDVTIDHATIVKNAMDTCCSGHPGVVQVSRSGSNHSLTITHSYIGHNTGAGVKSVNDTLILDHNDVIEDNTTYGVWFTADSTANSYNMGSINHSQVSDNGSQGIEIDISNAPTGLTYPVGSSNDIMHNAEGTAESEFGFGGNLPLDALSYDQFNWTNNYLGEVPVEFICPVGAVPGNTPNDPLFGLPYQMRDGVNLELDLVMDMVKERLSGSGAGSASNSWLAKEIETTVHHAAADLGFPEWFAITPSTTSNFGIIYNATTKCYYDEVPTAPASLSPIDNSSS